MDTLKINSQTTVTNSPNTSSLSLSQKFNTWCKEAESLRILFLSAFLLFQGCIVVPAILLVASFYDIGITGLSVTIAAFGTIAILVSNISEAPIKLVIVTFLVNLLISIGLIVVHLI